MVAAAIIGGAVIGGAASTVAGSKAAKAQKQAAQTASDTELQMYNQTREDQGPFREAGYTALKQLGDGTADGGDFNRDFTAADFVKDPGYQFRMDQGQQALERSAAARGGILNGGTLKALDRYGQDYASGEYSSAYSRFNADRDRRFGRLSQIAGIGKTATDTTDAAGANAARGVADAQISAGNARAANAVNTGNAINDTIGTLGSFYLQNKFLNGGGGGGFRSMTGAGTPGYATAGYA
jgi:hypothetical protein